MTVPRLLSSASGQWPSPLGSLNCRDLVVTDSSTRKQQLQLLLRPALEKSRLSCYGGAAPGRALGTRRMRQGRRASASLLTPGRPRCPRSCLSPSHPGSHRALLLSWPGDLLAAGVKFPTGTHSPTGRGGSQGLVGVSHPALLAHAFGLPHLSPMGPHQQRTM